MRFQRSLEIEQRLEKVLGLIRSGKYSTPQLAIEVGVSIPTISRCVEALRQRGYEIHSEKLSTGWHYVLEQTPRSNNKSARELSDSTL